MDEKLIERLRHEAALRAHYGDPILDEAADALETLRAQLAAAERERDEANFHHAEAERLLAEKIVNTNTDLRDQAIERWRNRAEVAERRVAELRPDAERYWWLRDGNKTWLDDIKPVICVKGDLMAGDKLDAAIDAALGDFHDETKDIADIAEPRPVTYTKEGARDLSAELRAAELEKDALRYRWLRDTMQSSVGGGIEVNDAKLVYEEAPAGEEVRVYWYPNTPVGFNQVLAATLDAAIDAARKG